MPIFDFAKNEAIGKVQSVDTASAVIKVERPEQLSALQVNQLLVIRASKNGQCLIGMVIKIMRKTDTTFTEDTDFLISSEDLVKVTLIGTLLDRLGIESNVFKRTLESVPSIDADCFLMNDAMLSQFMGVISQKSAETEHPLCIGTYTLNDQASALLDGNKMFQRHAVIVGSTGSGKSYTVATMIEQIAKLKSANAILFDIHGEYAPIVGEGIRHYKIAGPSDTFEKGILFLPYWMLTYDEMLSVLIDRSDTNAPNQAMIFSRTVMQSRQELLDSIHETLPFTIDSPIPYQIQRVLELLNEKDTEMVTGARGQKQGDFYGKLPRFIQRLTSKVEDKRFNFMFSSSPDLLSFHYLEDFCKLLMTPASQDGGVKIINFSEVPSDVLPLMVSLIARLIFSVQQWMDKDKIHPIALFCDEAHLYIPANAQQGVGESSLASFERIAKEGRKYGVGLVVITQRPSEVNHTVLSQSSNFIAMRLTNADDQNVVKRLLPDNLGNFAELLPILDVGEALVVGDASLLPSRIRVNLPEHKPDSATIKFWNKWSEANVPDAIADAVEFMRRQAR